MKLLLDENLSRRIVPLLQADYPNSSQVVLLQLEACTDREIWEYAKANDFVIVTRVQTSTNSACYTARHPK